MFCSNRIAFHLLNLGFCIWFLNLIFFFFFFNDFWNENKIKTGKSKNREDFIFWAEARRKYENPGVFLEIGKTWQLWGYHKKIKNRNQPWLFEIERLPTLSDFTCFCQVNGYVVLTRTVIASFCILKLFVYRFLIFYFLMLVCIVFYSIQIIFDMTYGNWMN